ncbi:MAG: hypothetical protein ABSE73_28910, partial [Planctomycetota bacterium]
MDTPADKSAHTLRGFTPPATGVPGDTWPATQPYAVSPAAAPLGGAGHSTEPTVIEPAAAAPGGTRVPTRLRLLRPVEAAPHAPLETLVVLGAGDGGGSVAVSDGGGREYFRAPAGAEVSFVIGGSLGTHTIQVLDEQGAERDRLGFQVEARTKIEDQNGDFSELFAILEKTLHCSSPDGTGAIQYRGQTYRYFLNWILDHSHTAKGMQYLSPLTGQLADLFRHTQRKDGMIWSFAVPADEGTYHESAYAPFGYAWRDGGVLFARQPVENHNEANFVDTVYLAWQGSGDDFWMTKNLDAAMRALDYSHTDRARWSTKYGLLKRGYTIDSWDFQVEDEHLVGFRLGAAQMIDEERTRFGVFF